MQDWAIGVVNGPVGAHILPTVTDISSDLQ